MSDFWEGILEAAQVIGVKKHLPSRWKVMCEQIRLVVLREGVGV